MFYNYSMQQQESTLARGLFGISEDHIEKYQSLDTRFIKNKASTFFFTAASQAMEPLIFRNDVLVVDRAINDFHNRVTIIALDGEMFCRRFIRRGKTIILKAENPQYKDKKISNENDLNIFGVVTAIARDV